MSETPDTQPNLSATPVSIKLAAVPSGTIKGVCLIEIWRMGGNKAPSVFWREVQADGVFSLWRFMEPAFAKKALKAREFTLDKDGHAVKYAARAFNSAKKATIEDYQRVRKLQAAFRKASDPLLLCRACQGSEEIQATRPLPGGKVQRFVTGCPECAPQPPQLDADEGTTSTAETVATALREAADKIDGGMQR